MIQPSCLLPFSFPVLPLRHSSRTSIQTNKFRVHTIHIMRHPSNSNLRAQTLWEVDDILSFANLTVRSPIIPAEPASVIPPKKNASRSSGINAEDYTKPFLDFISANPTVFHAVEHFANRLESAGFRGLSERDTWNSKLKHGGKYYVTRNGSSLVAFTIPTGYAPGKGVGIIVGHVDALTAKLKPVSKKPDSHGYVQLGVAPYAGALNSTWWDRDLGVGGRVLVKNSNGKIETKLVKLDYPIARIPTLAPHFGSAANGPFNLETQMVPIVGLESPEDKFIKFKSGSFAGTQPPRLVTAIAAELGITDYSSIVNWELELFDTQPAQLGGLSKELLFAPRIDDKLCSFSALEALIVATSAEDSLEGSAISLVGLFDDEEIGSRLRQGAAGNLMSSIIERVIESFSDGKAGANVLSQTYANSFVISADVTHAVNPNFLNAYLPDHSPQLNVGLTVAADSNGHMTTDSVSTAFLARIAEKSGNTLQVFQIRNDVRSGGTVGPVVSTATGIRAVDAGLAQLSMHSIRATCGSKDPGLGVRIFAAFFEHFEEVDAEFAE